MTKEEWNGLVEKDKEKYDKLKLQIMERSHLSEKQVNEICEEIFQIGFKEGQNYVWFMRSGFGIQDQEG